MVQGAVHASLTTWVQARKSTGSGVERAEPTELDSAFHMCAMTQATAHVFITMVIITILHLFKVPSPLARKELQVKNHNEIWRSQQSDYNKNRPKSQDTDKDESFTTLIFFRWDWTHRSNSLEHVRGHFIDCPVNTINGPAILFQAFYHKDVKSHKKKHLYEIINWHLLYSK